MKRSASARWEGDLKAGRGTISTESGVLAETPYSFGTRFESGTGTNPEELVAAAHAGCFTMALSAEFAKAGLVAERLDTKATVTLDRTDGGFAVTASHLELVARVPAATEATFRAAARAAETGCPISRLLKATITLDARLEN